MNGLLVIGYGNTLRSDDGAGIRAVVRIKESIADVDAVALHDLSPELAETVASYDAVVFLDAGVGIATLQVSPLTGDIPADPVRSHMLTPVQVLALARSLYGRAPGTAILIQIPASSFEFGETLSPTTAAAVEEAVAVVSEMARRQFRD